MLPFTDGLFSNLVSGVASALAGLDMAMPDSPFWNASLVAAVNNGSIAAERLDDMATRLVLGLRKE